MIWFDKKSIREKTHKMTTKNPHENGFANFFYFEYLHMCHIVKFQKILEGRVQRKRTLERFYFYSKVYLVSTLNILFCIQV